MRKTERWGKSIVVHLLSILEVRQIRVCVAIQVFNGFRPFNMKEIKKVFFI